MSFSIDPTAASGGFGSRGLLQNRSLKGIAIAVGVTATAIVLTAGHQIAAEEGRSLLNRMRSSHSTRRERNNAVLCALVSNENLPFDMIRYIEGQRDAFRAAIQVSINPDVPIETRSELRRTLRDLYLSSLSRAK